MKEYNIYESNLIHKLLDVLQISNLILAYL